MKGALNKYIVILSSCLFLGTCNISSISERYTSYIDIGDYDNLLKEWKSQNMLDYRLRLDYYCNDEHGYSIKKAVITVKNDIPESSYPPEWLTSGEMTTVPEVFSFIKKEESSLINTTASFSLSVWYNTVYHYPTGISKSDSSVVGFGWSWEIVLMPMAENVREAWDRLNLLDYNLHVDFYDYLNMRPLQKIIVTVRNGIPQSSDLPEWLADGKKLTVPDFFSFVKDEETRWGYFHPQDESLKVDYDIVYHYPCHISAPGYRWDIDLILPGKTK